MKKAFLTFTLFFIILAAPGVVQAQDLVYRPVNPAFGGESFNYQWLQSSAQSQDKLKDPNATTSAFGSQDPLDDFKQSLERQILNQLSRQLVTSQFGEGGLEPGSYTIGNYSIEVTEGTNGVVIQIVDIGTGNQTTVTVPYY
ncbi:curli production assembly/transport component CsgF [Pontibacter akesuensis]|uniref:Curli production assembly/transport component CsgF n=1 Tax=Pontibacter akesuensis TaxID=388950 RepID=A0A1I7H0N5_9BACT|nr:curli production assembly/transport component CsgF [Pontibacter akesuensis]GHA54123.1 curli production assembly protein CsgF [Pontibacter akesuensis]SFU54235.1 curli production assembly/transport component CsgF [Pontibacter akesuensis]